MSITPLKNEETAALNGRDGLDFVLRTTAVTVQPPGKDRTDVHIRPPAANRKSL